MSFNNIVIVTMCNYPEYYNKNDTWEDSMHINSDDIKIRINYPEQCYWDEEIESIKAKWILDQQLDLYGEENLSVVYPIWIRIKEIESTGITYEEAKQIAIDEYKSR